MFYKDKIDKLCWGEMEYGGVIDQPYLRGSAGLLKKVQKIPAKIPAQSQVEGMFHCFRFGST